MSIKSPLLYALSLLFLVGCATMTPMGEQRDQIILVRVKKNDTLNTIAKRHDTNWQAIAALNREQLTNGLREGQELRIRVNQHLVNSTDGSQAAVNGDEDEQGEDFLPKRKRGFFFFPRSSGEPPELVMPAPGRVSSHFGKRGRKLHKGIDIVAMVGTPIVASADGEVIFAGRQRGYGSTIVIDHGDYMTLYAHASKLIARTGDKVRRGDFIAKVGKTGNARGAHLHFELRDRDNKPLDPIRFMDNSNIASSVKGEGSFSGEVASELESKSSRSASRPTAKAKRLSKGKKRLLYARD